MVCHSYAALSMVQSPSPFSTVNFLLFNESLFMIVLYLSKI